MIIIICIIIIINIILPQQLSANAVHLGTAGVPELGHLGAVTVDAEVVVVLKKKR